MERIWFIFHPIKPVLDRKAFPIDFMLCSRSDGVDPSGFLHLAIIAILALLVTIHLFFARDFVITSISMAIR